MGFKNDLNDVLVEIKKLSENLTSLKNKAELLYNAAPEEMHDNDTKLFVSLKYSEIKHNDPNTWDSIIDLPRDILKDMYFRIEALPYNLHSDLAEKQMKELRSWKWDLSYVIKSVISNPVQSAHYLAEIKRKYAKMTSVSKGAVDIYFDIINDEILKYESK
jgi:hypothetical protein